MKLKKIRTKKCLFKPKLFNIIADKVFPCLKVVITRLTGHAVFG
jgi:hypothetical protein